MTFYPDGRVVDDSGVILVGTFSDTDNRVLESAHEEIRAYLHAKSIERVMTTRHGVRM